MKEEYLRTMELLKTVPSLRWIDRDKGQIDMYENPPVDFPCALITTEITSSREITPGVQQCYGKVVIRLAHAFIDETSSVTPDEVQQISLEYYDISQEVYLAIQGKAGARGGNYSRTSWRQESTRGDNLAVVKFEFQLNYIDRSAMQ